MFYISAVIAVAGAVGYQYFIKRIPDTINPIVSVLAMYLAVVVIGVFLLILFPSEGGIRFHIRQVTWIQVALAVTVFLIEFGYIMMYRNGWQLSSGSLVTGVFINIILLGMGITLFDERVSTVNIIGILLSIVGVAMISYKH